VPPDILVPGLKEFTRDVRKIETGLGKELGRANKDVGIQIVKLVEKRRSAMASRFPSYRSKIVRIRPSATQRNVTITVRPGAAELGSRRHPVYGRWRDQSGFKRRVWPREMRPTDGYLVRPAVTDNVDEVAQVYVERIGRFARNVIGG
jgi:hypothetical protein